MRNYEDLEVWQKAHALTLRVYRITDGFPGSEMFGLTSQIRRARSSIGANLAEGCGRWGDAELVRYVQIVMGSASELQNHLRLARDLGFLRPNDYASVLRNVTSVRQMLTAFLQKLRGVRQTQEPPRACLAKSEKRTAKSGLCHPTRNGLVSRS